MDANGSPLTEKERGIYTRFIEWLKKSWYGVPDSEFVLPYVAARYTPDEAQLLTGMPYAPKTLAELAELTGVGADVLGPKLDELAAKGLVFRQARGSDVIYNLQDIFSIYRGFGWPGSTDEYSRAVGPLQHKYIMHGLMSPWKDIKEKGLRVLPIGVTIEEKSAVLPYEEARRVLDKVEYFTVSHCPCRHANNLDPDSPDCRFPTEVCLHFDRLGRYIVENGMGREITRQETEEILKQCAELGLVHGISNQQEKPDTICNCCSDCCIWFLAVKNYRHACTLTASNFRISLNQATCIGCGLCAERCPMEALHLVDMPSVQGRKTTVTGKDGIERELTNRKGRLSELDPARCIGCGVCAYKCPSHSLSLERTPADHHPPQTGRDWIMRYMEDIKAARQKA